MLVIGITGSLATGKSTVAAMLRRRGAKVLDADKITHQLMKRGARCYAPIVRKFGKEVEGKEAIDRNKLAALVFTNAQKLKALENIIHPEVIKMVEKEIKKSRVKKEKVFVIDAPLLIESGLHRAVDFLITVKANRKKQLGRIMRRAKINQADALRRIKMQMSLKDKIRMSDIIIDNRGTLAQTQKQVDEVWQKLRHIRQSHS